MHWWEHKWWERWWERVQGVWMVTGSTIRRYPSTLVIPLCLFGLLLSLGIIGVAAGQKNAVEHRKNDAAQLASTTLTAVKLTVQQAYATVAAIGVYLTTHPFWPSFAASFDITVQALLSISIQNPQLVQIEMAPSGVISAVFPDWVGGNGFDLLDPVVCNFCSTDAMREVAMGNLTVDGPFLLGQSNRSALIASLPVFVASNYSQPGPDPEWQVPLSKGTCNIPQCYNVTEGTRWYGTVYALIIIDELLADPATKLSQLEGAGWRYVLKRGMPVPTHNTRLLQYLSPPLVLMDPITATLTISETVYELQVAPINGWTDRWWPAVYVAVVLVSFVLALLVFLALLGKHQKTWLLYSILPKKVVQTLRRGSEWSQKRDCTVLFADVVGFTRITSTMAPEDIATMVGELFRIYEDLTRAHGATKVDIIGDCFMAAAGMLEPEPPEVCAVKIASLALDMVYCTRGLSTRTGEPIQVRIGLHAGLVVAVLVGVQSPKLTVFGDVVNTCSRLQSTSLPGCVQVSDVVAERLIAVGGAANGMTLIERGSVELRNRGVLRTWWLLNIDDDDTGLPMCGGMDGVDAMGQKHLLHFSEDAEAMLAACSAHKTASEAAGPASEPLADELNPSCPSAPRAPPTLAQSGGRASVQQLQAPAEALLPLDPDGHGLGGSSAHPTTQPQADGAGLARELEMLAVGAWSQGVWQPSWGQQQQLVASANRGQTVLEHPGESEQAVDEAGPHGVAWPDVEGPVQEAEGPSDAAMGSGGAPGGVHEGSRQLISTAADRQLHDWRQVEQARSGSAWHPLLNPAQVAAPSDGGLPGPISLANGSAATTDTAAAVAGATVRAATRPSASARLEQQLGQGSSAGELADTVAGVQGSGLEWAPGGVPGAPLPASLELLCASTSSAGQQAGSGRQAAMPPTPHACVPGVLLASSTGPAPCMLLDLPDAVSGAGSHSKHPAAQLQGSAAVPSSTVVPATGAVLLSAAGQQCVSAGQVGTATAVTTTSAAAVLGSGGNEGQAEAELPAPPMLALSARDAGAANWHAAAAASSLPAPPVPQPQLALDSPLHVGASEVASPLGGSLVAAGASYVLTSQDLGLSASSSLQVLVPSSSRSPLEEQQHRLLRHSDTAALRLGASAPAQPAPDAGGSRATSVQQRGQAAACSQPAPTLPSHAASSSRLPHGEAMVAAGSPSHLQLVRSNHLSSAASSTMAPNSPHALALPDAARTLGSATQQLPVQRNASATANALVAAMRQPSLPSQHAAAGMGGMGSLLEAPCSAKSLTSHLQGAHAAAGPVPGRRALHEQSLLGLSGPQRTACSTQGPGSSAPNSHVSDAQDPGAWALDMCSAGTTGPLELRSATSVTSDAPAGCSAALVQVQPRTGAGSVTWPSGGAAPGFPPSASGTTVATQWSGNELTAVVVGPAGGPRVPGAACCGSIPGAGGNSTSSNLFMQPLSGSAWFAAGAAVPAGSSASLSGASRATLWASIPRAAVGGGSSGSAVASALGQALPQAAKLAVRLSSGASTSDGATLAALASRSASQHAMPSANSRAPHAASAQPSSALANMSVAAAGIAASAPVAAHAHAEQRSLHLQPQAQHLVLLGSSATESQPKAGASPFLHQLQQRGVPALGNHTVVSTSDAPAAANVPPSALATHHALPSHHVVSSLQDVAEVALVASSGAHMAPVPSLADSLQAPSRSSARTSAGFKLVLGSTPYVVPTGSVAGAAGGHTTLQLSAATSHSVYQVQNAMLALGYGGVGSSVGRGAGPSVLATTTAATSDALVGGAGRLHPRTSMPEVLGGHTALVGGAAQDPRATPAQGSIRVSASMVLSATGLVALPPNARSSAVHSTAEATGSATSVSQPPEAGTGNGDRRDSGTYLREQLRSGGVAVPNQQQQQQHHHQGRMAWRSSAPLPLRQPPMVGSGGGGVASPSEAWQLHLASAPSPDGVALHTPDDGHLSLSTHMASLWDGRPGSAPDTMLRPHWLGGVQRQSHWAAAVLVAPAMAASSRLSPFSHSVIDVSGVSRVTSGRRSMDGTLTFTCPPGDGLREPQPNPVCMLRRPSSSTLHLTSAHGPTTVICPVDGGLEGSPVDVCSPPTADVWTPDTTAASPGSGLGGAAQPSSGQPRRAASKKSWSWWKPKGRDGASGRDSGGSMGHGNAGGSLRGTGRSGATGVFWNKQSANSILHWIPQTQSWAGMHDMSMGGGLSAAEDTSHRDARGAAEGDSLRGGANTRKSP